MDGREVIPQNPDNNPDVNNQGNLDSLQGQENLFQIPQEYAERGWTKTAPQFKDQDEYVQWITKQYDAQQDYVGGKLDKLVQEKGLVSIPDFTNEEQAKSFFEKLTPQDVNQYPTTEFQSDDAKQFFNNAFKDAGLAVPQAKKMIDAFHNYQNQVLEQATNKNDYEAKMSDIFGKDFETAKTPVDNMLKNILSAEDMQLINDKLPNDLVAVMYKVSKGLADKYGYKEQPQGGTNPQKTTAMTADEKRAKHAEHLKELQALSSKPHTQQEKNGILDKINNLYKQ